MNNILYFWRLHISVFQFSLTHAKYTRMLFNSTCIIVCSLGMLKMEVCNGLLIIKKNNNYCFKILPVSMDGLLFMVLPASTSSSLEANISIMPMNLSTELVTCSFLTASSPLESCLFEEGC